MKVTINGVEKDITEEMAKSLGIDVTDETKTEERVDTKVDNKTNDKTSDPIKDELEAIKKRQRDIELREQIQKAKDKYGFTEQVIREKILPISMERNLSFDEVVAIKKSELSDDKSFNEFFGLTDGKDPKIDTSGGSKTDTEFRIEGLAKVLSHGAKIKNIEV